MRTRPVSEWALSLARGELDAELAPLYPGETNARDRYLLVLDAFSRCFPAQKNVALISAPGRAELGGNHTDHQRGRVLAAAVSLDILAAVAPNEDGRIRIYSEGMPHVDVKIDELAAKKEEEGTSASLVRGVAAGIAELGGIIGGFDAAMTSSIPVGAGLSSSAAYEILIGTIFSGLYNGGALVPVQLSAIGHRAENEYFNKPCGMMDQTACAVGGVVAIDFLEPQAALVEKINCDFHANGYRLMITQAGGSHAGLTEEYAAIPREMRAVASAMGAEVLRQVDEAAFYEKLPSLRRRTGDRAVLRAMHFFGENRRTLLEAQALRSGDFGRFASLMRESGASSELMLQNIWPCDHGEERSLAFALAASARLLAGKGGAWRVHGGGFAGTVLALVPNSEEGEYRNTMNRLMGSAAACRALGIRPVGGYAMRGGES